ncbi:Crp/Fnr family transcriptional regulator [Paenibacillus aceris]|uniref:CRP-like cAMP-binding protein n=1 Tax=Paenibacillus aceris TaxID=869555 RepID=A0ABS4I269_9BACL|nr:Crp/Fnr family transcriptional regulator [Paenibacillus aceris]MBP1965011.1 CRP-like cAMP-binding protein [Paenibacillus aceris]NHW35671.1 Crp/Fnr family transcriptional regulator [Paenibacillus aceris]
MSNLRYKLEPYLSYAQVLHFKKKASIYRQGEGGKGFYYLEQGGVKIVLLSDNGHERIVDYIQIGTLLGEHGVSKSPYLTSAFATSPSILYYFSDEALTKMCKDHPEAALIFTNSLIYKVRLLAELIAFHDSPVKQQTAYYLLKLLQIHENENIPIDQTSLARYVDTSRITVNTIVQKWKSLGLIEFSHPGTIRITNIDKLREIVNNSEHM